MTPKRRALNLSVIFACLCFSKSVTKNLDVLIKLIGAFHLSVRTGRPDHCRTSPIGNKIGFSQGIFAQKQTPWCILYKI